MTIATVGTLFPAIPLAIVALNFRYTSLAGLMRNISSQIEMPEVNQSRQGARWALNICDLRWQSIGDQKTIYFN